MGLLTQSVRAALPFPPSRPRRFTGWGSDYFGGSSVPFRLPGEQDVRRSVQDGSGTALITAAINWMSRELVPARPVLHEYPEEGEGGVPKIVRQHAALDILRQPNPFYDGTTMRMACAASYIVDGNVYRWKIRSAMGRVVAEWWLPHWCVEPIGLGNFIDHYRFMAAGTVQEIKPADIKHLRFGLDPQNPRKGLSPIRGVLREVYTDEEAARFSAALMHNLGFPGAVVIPGQGVELGDEEGPEIKKRFDEQFGGDGRGKTIVLGANAEVKFLSWSPQELDLSSLRDVPEERVSSVLGIPAAVLGFGTGLQQVKVGATMRELRSMGWEGALIPFLEQYAENETRQMLPDFLGSRELARTEVAFDLSRIAALSEMQLRKAEIEATLVRARIKKVDEARMALGLASVGGEDGGFQASPGVGAKDAPAKPTGPSQEERDDEEDENEKDEEEALLVATAAQHGDGLTPREREVAVLAGTGRTNKEIAAALDVTERSVERYVASAKTKLGVVSRAELGAWNARQPKREDAPDPLRELAAASIKQAEAVIEIARATREGAAEQAKTVATIAKAVTERPPRTIVRDVERDERGRMKRVREREE